MTTHRAPLVTWATATIGALVAWITARPEAPRWAIGIAIAVLGFLGFLVAHFYFVGGGP